MPFLRRDREDDLSLFPTLHSRTDAAATSTTSAHDEGQLAVDVYETERDIVLRSAIAGVRPERLEVFVHHGMLTVRGTRPALTEAGSRPIVRECHWGGFSRSVLLPADVDPDRVAATIVDGVLTVRMSKIERSKKIEVKKA